MKNTNTRAITYHIRDSVTKELIATANNDNEMWAATLEARRAGRDITVYECRPVSIPQGRFITVSTNPDLLDALNSLTHGELQVLKAHFKAANEGCGASTVGELLADNYSWADADDFARLTGYSVNACKGFMSSLSAKGFMVSAGDRDTDGLRYINEWVLERMNPEAEITSGAFLA